MAFWAIARRWSRRQTSPGICSATVADRVVLKHSGGNSYYTIGSATVADQAGLKPNPFSNMRTLMFSNHDRSGRSQTQRSFRIFFTRSATMTDQAGLKPVGADTTFEQGLSISKNCKICQVFLFLRPARPFFDQALGSPQASIPALTAVWVHFSTFAWEGVGWGSSAGR